MAHTFTESSISTTYHSKGQESPVRVQPFDTIGNHEVLWSETYQRFTLSCFLMPLSPTTNNLSPVINTARPRRCFSGVYGRCRTDFPQQYAMFCDYFFVIIKRIWLTLQPSREDCVLRLFFSQCPNVYPVGLAFRGFSLFLFLATCSFVPCRVIYLSAFPEAVYK